MNKKEFFTIHEQIEMLRKKGLIVNNEKIASDILLRENYFFINGYRHPFMDSNKKFFKGTTFEELYSLFLFDRELRNTLFKNLLIVENNLKSIMSYTLSKKYGYKEKDYLKPENFIQNISEQRRVLDVLEKMKRQIRVNSRKHSATLHYINNYGYIPMWVLVKVLSFGLVNELFGILKEEDKKEICEIYLTSPENMEIFIAILSNYRNLCAHEDILFGHKTQRSIPDSIYHEKLKIIKVDDEYLYGKNDLFALIIVLKTMLTKRKFKEMMNEINEEVQILFNNVKTLNKDELLNLLSFPKNYNDISEM